MENPACVRAGVFVWYPKWLNEAVCETLNRQQNGIRNFTDNMRSAARERVIKSWLGNWSHIEIANGIRD